MCPGWPARAVSSLRSRRSSIRSSQPTTRTRWPMCWAWPASRPRPFEFQRLHGMGEDLYASLARVAKRPVPCRVYAPVGSHEELLPYLVRRLLENGANTSFVNRIVDERLPVAEIIRDPVAQVDALRRDSASEDSRSAGPVRRGASQLAGTQPCRSAGVGGLSRGVAARLQAAVCSASGGGRTAQHRAQVESLQSGEAQGCGWHGRSMRQQRTRAPRSTLPSEAFPDWEATARSAARGRPEPRRGCFRGTACGVDDAVRARSRQDAARRAVRGA